jgi:hypothetical protein
MARLITSPAKRQLTASLDELHAAGDADADADADAK